MPICSAVVHFQGRQLMLVKVSMPMEQDPTIDSSDSHVRNCHIERSSQKKDEDVLTQQPRYLTESPVHLRTETSVTSDRGIFADVADASHCTLRPRAINLRTYNGQQNFNRFTDSLEVANGSLENNLDISNVHEFSPEHMNISSVKKQNSSDKGLNKRTVMSTSGSSEMTSSISANSNSGVTERFIDTGIPKQLNVEEKRAFDQGENRQFFDDIDRHWDSESEYKDPVEFNSNTFNVPLYQEANTSGSGSNDSMTELKEYMQQNTEFAKYVGSSPDSGTYLKQPVFYVDSDQSSEKDHSDNMVTDPVNSAKFNTEFSNLVSNKKWNGSEMRSQEGVTERDFIQGQSVFFSCIKAADDRTDINVIGNDSFGSPDYKGDVILSNKLDSACPINNQFDHGITESKGLPQYLDFNKYPQFDINPQNNKDNTRVMILDYEMQKTLTNPKQLQQNISQECRPNHTTATSYEKLNPCPSNINEFSYEQNLHENTSPDIPTIADVFTPVEETFPIQDFKTIESSDSGFQPDECTRESLKQKRQTQPVTVLDTMQKKSKTRHTVAGTTMQRVHFQEHGIESRRHSSPSATVHQCHQVAHGSPNTSWRPALPPRRCNNGYIRVPAGTSNRQSLDKLLANDQLFNHYNNTLRNCCGWSPKETDHTVRKSLLI